MDLKSLIDEPSKLPTISKVTQQLIASFGSDDVSVTEIGHQLAADPALSAKLLKLANSAYFQVSRTIGTVDAALQMLGMVMARNLVLGSSVAGAFRSTIGIDLPQFWRYNLYTACVARWLAQRTDVSADRVFTLALLHAIGQLQMHAIMPQAMVPLDQQMNVLDPGRAQLEQQIFGFNYGDVSAELALAWKLPLPLTEALRHIARPLAAPDFLEASALVHLAAWRARAEVLGWSDAEQVASYPGEVGQRLHLQPTWTPALAALAQLDSPQPVLPPLGELTAGLEAMFD
ncbi:HDOD domain-containing protein [Rhodoferax antarcticus]|uniref:HDOD domain-containing protein n=1 Tax=Rhodoferax antarcticus TaxID=81479 RepID=UPI002223FD40|nr:HDOD domain-containing protein [Rhodoferax antarcticus]MCW2310504.1 HD-like signal output (HDOD) protein [Rhodoferax antarcticus]